MMMGGEMIGAGNGSVIDDNGYYQFVVSLLDESAAAAAAAAAVAGGGGEGLGGNHHPHSSSLAFKRDLESLVLNDDDCRTSPPLHFLSYLFSSSAKS